MMPKDYRRLKMRRAAKAVEKKIKHGRREDHRSYILLKRAAAVNSELLVLPKVHRHKETEV